MPIFEYICNACGFQFEILARSSKATDKQPTCPSCQSLVVQKKLSAFAINSNGGDTPDCAPQCGGGFEKGCCGSGHCGCGH